MSVSKEKALRWSSQITEIAVDTLLKSPVHPFGRPLMRAREQTKGSHTSQIRKQEPVNYLLIQQVVVNSPQPNHYNDYRLGTDNRHVDSHLACCTYMENLCYLLLMCAYQ